MISQATSRWTETREWQAWIRNCKKCLLSEMRELPTHLWIEGIMELRTLAFSKLISVMIFCNKPKRAEKIGWFLFLEVVVRQVLRAMLLSLGEVIATVSFSFDPAMERRSRRYDFGVTFGFTRVLLPGLTIVSPLNGTMPTGLKGDLK